LFQPIEKPVSQAAEYANLREMYVRVDESGQNVAAAQVADRGVRMGFRDGTVIAAIDHFSILNRQCPIRVPDQCVRGEKRIPGRVKNGGSENVHP